MPIAQAMRPMATPITGICIERDDAKGNGANLFFGRTANNLHHNPALTTFHLIREA